MAILLVPALGQPSTAASVRLDRGVEFAHSGRFNEAAQEFIAALAIDPKLAEAHYLLGLVRQTWGKWDDARESYAAALRLKPRYPEAQLGLAAVMTRVVDETTLDEAIAACREAVALNPNEAEAHFHLASNEMLRSHFEIAAAEYQATVRLRADYPGARLGLADALVQLRAFDRAVPILQSLAASQPKEARVYHLLGVVSSKRSDAATAVRHLLRAAALDPTSPQTRYILSTNLRKLGRTEQAEEELRQFRQLTAGKADRMQAEFHLLLAQKQMRRGKVPEAILEYQEALSHRDNPAVATDLGVALISANRVDEAIGVLRDVSATQPGSVLAHYHLGLAYAQKKDYARARQALETALRLRPEFPEALFNLGMAYAMEGQLAEAEKRLRESIRLRPDLGPTHHYLGVVLKDLGKPAEAEAEFEIARQLQPERRQLPDGFTAK